MDGQGARRNYRKRVRRQRRVARSRLNSLLQQQQHRCHYCQQPIMRLRAILPHCRVSVDRGFIRFRGPEGYRLVRMATVDHRQPLRDGGTSDVSNLVAACWSCNQQRAGHISLSRPKKKSRRPRKTVDPRRRLVRLLHQTLVAIAARRGQLRRARRRCRYSPRNAQLHRSVSCLQRQLRLLYVRRDRLRQQLANLNTTRRRATGSSLRS